MLFSNTTEKPIYVEWEEDGQTIRRKIEPGEQVELEVPGSARLRSEANLLKELDVIDEV